MKLNLNGQHQQSITMTFLRSKIKNSNRYSRAQINKTSLWISNSWQSLLKISRQISDARSLFQISSSKSLSKLCPSLSRRLTSSKMPHLQHQSTGKDFLATSCLTVSQRAQSPNSITRQLAKFSLQQHIKASISNPSSTLKITHKDHCNYI